MSLLATPLAAQEDAASPALPAPEPREALVEGDTPQESEGTVTTYADPRPQDSPGKASTTVTREQLQERLPRSAPDALRYEPGVFVQQTAHSQGSAFIRGRTGQQTIIAFDDVRLNNSLFRQGPNQYFFTIDARTIDHIEVTRGSSSTRYGTDAISGTINATPIGPSFRPANLGPLTAHPTLIYRTGTADGETGGRLQLDAALNEHVGLLMGVGARTVGMLESGGPIYNPSNGELPQVPRFEPDGRTQRGTGFDELTGDLRAVFRITPKLQATLAAYAYHQFDAPRTDQCPPAYAPYDECLKYDEQFRDLAYLSVDGDWGAVARKSRLIFSLQRQHEARSYERPSSRAVNRGQDEVLTSGLLWKAETARWRTAKARSLLRYGFDYYKDSVTSSAETELQNLGKIYPLSRGQYLSGSTYGWGGVWGEAETVLWERAVLRAGARLSHVQVDAPQDEESGTLGVDRTWSPVVGNVGAEWWATTWLTLLANVDQGFRAPNLDDLTSRQRTGPGFQIENALLEPEHGETYEVGVKISRPRFESALWAYRSTLRNAMIRTTRDVDACPVNTPECRTTWSRLQLVNLPGEAVILGAEGNMRVTITPTLTLTSTLSYAWGEGPRPLVQADNADQVVEDRVPLSRVPPLNGSAELTWRARNGAYLGAASRFARPQTRLALSDISDERIPLGGTPGFVVFDARAGWRFNPTMSVHGVFENLLDAAYRYHGSSTNGAGRSFTLQAEIGW